MILIETPNQNGKTEWGVSLTNHDPEPEDYIACASGQDAERLIDRCRKAPVVVPNNVSADDANRLYGEAFGKDWSYEG